MKTKIIFPEVNVNVFTVIALNYEAPYGEIRNRKNGLSLLTPKYFKFHVSSGRRQSRISTNLFNLSVNYLLLPGNYNVVYIFFFWIQSYPSRVASIQGSRTSSCYRINSRVNLPFYLSYSRKKRQIQTLPNCINLFPLFIIHIKCH